MDAAAVVAGMGTTVAVETTTTALADVGNESAASVGHAQVPAAVPAGAVAV